ncbi:hypothetical protein H0H93_015825, partial [Arthromyces matolae]
EFSTFVEELIPEDQGDISLILDYDSIADSLTVEAVAEIEEVTKDPVLVSSFAVTDSSVPIPSWSHSTLADSVSPPPSIEDSIYAYLYLTASNLFRSYSAADFQIQLLFPLPKYFTLPNRQGKVYK